MKTGEGAGVVVREDLTRSDTGIHLAENRGEYLRDQTEQNAETRSLKGKETKNESQRGTTASKAFSVV